MRVQAWVLLRHFVYLNEKVKLRLSPVDEDVYIQVVYQRPRGKREVTMRKTQEENEVYMRRTRGKHEVR